MRDMRCVRAVYVCAIGLFFRHFEQYTLGTAYICVKRCSSCKTEFIAQNIVHHTKQNLLCEMMFVVQNNIHRVKRSSLCRTVFI